MSSGSPPPPLEGFYTSKSGIQIPFTAFAHKDCVAIILEKPVGQLAAISQHSRGQILHITPASFEDLKLNVLDKDIDWSPVIVILSDKMREERKAHITGTWSSKQATVGGIRRARSSKSSKPTKRRRSRRVYRKTKKN
jgi:hypothetical protein